MPSVDITLLDHACLVTSSNMCMDMDMRMHMLVITCGMTRSHMLMSTRSKPSRSAASTCGWPP
eukprot:4009246-Prymnesium_polylepis.1